jgi:hypothetical protein
MFLAGIALTAAVCPTAGQVAPSASPDNPIPEALAPFEHLIGAWKGQGIPTANKLRGWPERHLWAWAFADGQPVALTIEFEGSKLLKQARLSYQDNAYRLEGLDAQGQPVAFSGSLDSQRQNLTLERDAPHPDGTIARLILRLNSNQIRYVLWDERRPKGAVRFARATEILMGKEGESFAAGSAAANLPKCIITGGAATLSVSHQGRSYPVCCTGCRDEFLADPERWLKKLADRNAAARRPPADDPPPNPQPPPSQPCGETPAPDSRTSCALDSSHRADQRPHRGFNSEFASEPPASITRNPIVFLDETITPSTPRAAARFEAFSGNR